MSGGFLSRAYGARDGDGTRRLYDDWAATYEDEITASGYATPQRCAAALAAFSRDKTQPILDFGCGTGLSGAALKLAGFEVIDGIDLSEAMLDQARHKGIYRHLEVVAPDAPLRHAPGDYAAIAAIGAIGAGAAPLSAIDAIMRGLARGGLFVFSFNDHALADPCNEGRVNEWIDCGAARLLMREHGEHLPAIGVRSTVYVLEKN